MTDLAAAVSDARGCASSPKVIGSRYPSGSPSAYSTRSKAKATEVFSRWERMESTSHMLAERICRALPPNQRRERRNAGKIASSLRHAGASNTSLPSALDLQRRQLGLRPGLPHRRTVGLHAQRRRGCTARTNRIRGPRTSTDTAACPIGGNSTCPKSSTGVCPSSADRSSSAYWGKRERFATTSTRSSPARRMKAKTLELLGWSISSVPWPRASEPCRSAISRFIQESSEFGLFCCVSTLTVS